MAFMEKPAAGKVLLDDTVPLTAAIEASQSLQSHTEYIIRVQRGISVENSWQIIRRYSDFDLLNNSLQIAGLSLPLPPKKLIGNMDREFIAERQKGLQNYLNVITTNHILSNCELVKKFLDPNNYSANYTGEKAAQDSGSLDSLSSFRVAFMSRCFTSMVPTVVRQRAI
uniref:PX domain containing serine/threonine kinase like n=1 Tax=Equus asinus TaxID=9793 RepID=A0A9L0I6E7_EQUAS